MAPKWPKPKVLQFFLYYCMSPRKKEVFQSEPYSSKYGHQLIARPENCGIWPVAISWWISDWNILFPPLDNLYNRVNQTLFVSIKIINDLWFWPFCPSGARINIRELWIELWSWAQSHFVSWHGCWEQCSACDSRQADILQDVNVMDGVIR